METVNYGEFSRELHERLLTDRYPSEATIEVTRRCPLACAHCYNNLPMSDTEARRSELSLEEHRRLLDQLSEAGCLWLLYTGGEIFARRDFLEIYTYAKRKGFLITLFTNGTLITPEIADYLAEWRPFAIEITLYGRTRETYEKLTGIPGSFDRCIRGIELLKERKLPLALKTVAVTINRHEIWEMKRYAETELGLSFKFDALMSPRIDCSQSPLAVRLTPEETVELDLQDPVRVSEWRKFAERFAGPVNTSAHAEEVYHCGGGLNSFAIDPQGRMSICVLSHFDTYDLRRGSFTEGWNDFLLRVRRKKMTMRTKCVACEIKAMCGMCPANGELESGHAEKPVDHLCHVAHLRARSFEIEIPPHGVCEYCEGGSRSEDVRLSAVSLRERKALSVTSAQAQSRYLPVMSTASAASDGACGGGCSACSPH
ncbi:MAG TPA: radical SAM protein [Pyrinomonadaceae bacterium]|jgi:radical SAM protein with 4Fe4S-binding SPASM domain|nr:radical SAM protein [Pyrinomonadaceae bacterium]